MLREIKQLAENISIIKAGEVEIQIVLNRVLKWMNLFTEREDII